MKMSLRKGICHTCRGYTTASRASTSKQTLYDPPLPEIQSHLSSLLAPLRPLPDRLALRIATHRSAVTNKVGNHNHRPAFYGRRILRMHLSILLSSQSSASMDLLGQNGALIANVLDTHEMGNGPGRELGLEKIMRWREVWNEGGKSGLYKIRGETLQALVAGIWSHYGANTSMRFINSRILPKLTLPPSLQTVAEELARQDADLSQKGTALLALPSSRARMAPDAVPQPLTQAVFEDRPPLKMAAGAQ